MNRSAASLVSPAVGLGISTALLSALLSVASAHTAGAADANFTALTKTMTTARFFHTATLLPSGQVLIAGGGSSPGDDNTTYDTTELYDPAANTFTALTKTMTTPREGHAATRLLNDLVLITGGFNDQGSGDSLNTAEVYDPVANQFTPLTATMAYAHSHHTSTLLPNGQVLITGPGNGGAELNTAELYDPAANTFTALTKTMTTPRGGHTATRLLNDLVLITGGCGPTQPACSPGSWMVLNTAELYDPVANTFTALTKTMTTTRFFHTATLLSSGQVLLTGGAVGSSSLTVLSTAEVYDAVAETFTALTDTMTTARAGHTATLLPNGQVIITGGLNNSAGTALNTAELYTSGPAATPTPTATNTPTAALTACVGDCSGDGEVTVNEIITLVNIALGTQHVSECANGLPATATDADVTVAVIIQAVNNALNGCGG